jgi:hypothetical protein
MKKQRGQAVVEFALVLPLFMCLLMCVIFAGLLFSDYMTLSNVARSSVREASIQGPDNYSTIINHYKTNTHLLTNLYNWPDLSQGNSMEFNEGEFDNSVEVTLTASLNNSFPGIPVLEMIFGRNVDGGTAFLPQNFVIKYTMYDESANTTNNSNGSSE